MEGSDLEKFLFDIAILGESLSVPKLSTKEKVLAKRRMLGLR